MALEVERRPASPEGLPFLPLAVAFALAAERRAVQPRACDLLDRDAAHIRRLPRCGDSVAAVLSRARIHRTRPDGSVRRRADDVEEVEHAGAAAEAVPAVNRIVARVADV